MTGLEQDKISSEYSELIDNIQTFLEILANPDKLQEVIRGELTEVRAAYADKRRTEIVENYDDLTVEDLIPEETVVVTLSHAGYAKSQPAEVYQAQRRGGRGRTAARVKDEDFIDQLFVANSHDTVLCFSSRGKAYWLKVYQVPQAAPGRARPADRQPVAARGRRAHQHRAAGARRSRKTSSCSSRRSTAPSRRRRSRRSRGRARAASSPSSCATTIA